MPEDQGSILFCGCRLICPSFVPEDIESGETILAGVQDGSPQWGQITKKPVSCIEKCNP